MSCAANYKRCKAGTVNFKKRSQLPLLSALLLLAMLLAGCPSPPQPGGPDNEQAARAWQKFLDGSARAGERAAPFNATLSVRYKTPEEGERFGAYLWSNLERLPAEPGQTGQPLRLDILGAMNSTAAMAYEDDGVFLLYDTENNLAYRTDGSAESLMRLGVPLPLRLADLAQLLNGRYAAFFLSSGPGGSPDEALPPLVGSSGPDSIYALASGRGGQLTLDPAGRPLRWLESSEAGWVFEFSYPVGAQAGQLNLPGPMRIQASHPDGYSVSVQVKTLNTPARPFTPDQLRLNLPDTVKIKQS